MVPCSTNCRQLACQLDLESCQLEPATCLPTWPCNLLATWNMPTWAGTLSQHLPATCLPTWPCNLLATCQLELATWQQIAGNYAGNLYGNMHVNLTLPASCWQLAGNSAGNLPANLTRPLETFLQLATRQPSQPKNNYNSWKAGLALMALAAKTGD